MKQYYPKTFVTWLSTGSPAAGKSLPWFSVALLLLLLLAFGQARSAWGAAYHGQVVDAETGKPIEGAVVMVEWQKKAFLSMNGGWSFHNARETLTDADGKFSLSSAEGINLNPFTFVQEPRIIVFSPGYRPLTPYNPGEFKHVYGIAEALEKGATVKLAKITTEQESRRYTDSAGFGLIMATYEMIPNFYRLINVQRKMGGMKELQYP